MKEQPPHLTHRQELEWQISYLRAALRKGDQVWPWMSREDRDMASARLFAMRSELYELTHVLALVIRQEGLAMQIEAHKVKS